MRMNSQVCRCRVLKKQCGPWNGATPHGTDVYLLWKFHESECTQLNKQKTKRAFFLHPSSAFQAALLFFRGFLHYFYSITPECFTAWDGDSVPIRTWNSSSPRRCVLYGVRVIPGDGIPELWRQTVRWGWNIYLSIVLCKMVYYFTVIRLQFSILFWVYHSSILGRSDKVINRPWTSFPM